MPIKISACTFLRNAEMLCYPYIESILSILDYVDEFVINVGQSEDNTLAKIESLALNNQKIRIIHSIWNENMQAKGFVYAQQKMIAQYNCTGDWVFYLEADEILHDDDAKNLRETIHKYHNNAQVEALAFKYYHFYGAPYLIARSPAWYRSEVRIIRNNIRTYAPDGLFWVVMDKHRKARYPRAVLLDIYIYHYGHIRNLESMQMKASQVSKYWSHEAPKINYSNIDAQIIKPWHGNHPNIIKDWLKTHAQKLWKHNPNYKISTREKKHRLSMLLEKWFNLDLSKKHYKKINLK